VEDIPRPSVVVWYRVYCVASAAFYLLIASVFVLGMTFDPSFTQGVQHPEAFRIFAWIFATFILMFGALFAVSFLFGRTPSAWVYHLVLICFGLSNGLFLFGCIPLLIFWLKPETKAYFGRTG
jgi:hypothetical protein